MKWKFCHIIFYDVVKIENTPALSLEKLILFLIRR